jgi:imidazolonepropionase-like amidohydrolase
LRGRGTATSARAVVCLCALAIGVASDSRSARAEGPEVWAITGARIVTVSGAPIEKGTVVVRDGLITDVGVSPAVPGDARVVDGTGLTVYPGLVDAYAQAEAEKKADPADRRAPDRDNPPGVMPHRSALDLLKPGSRDETMRNAGITTVLAVPAPGIFAGRSALVNLNGGSIRAMSVATPVALHVTFDTQGGFTDFPGSTMGVISVIRQEFLNAQRHKLAWAQYARAPKGMKRPQPNEDFDVLVDALDRKIPVVFHAHTDREIRRAIRLAREFNLRYAIQGGAEAWKSADALKADNAPVLVTLNFPEYDKDAAPADSVTLGALRAIEDAPANAAKLNRAGVRIAFASVGLRSPKDFLGNAAKAVAAGLPKDKALEAMTLGSARILGVDQQLGSVEKGKIANLVVADGDLLEKKTKIKYVFVDGTRYELKEDAAAAAAKAAGPATVDATGTWNLTVEAPDARRQLTLVLKQSGTDLQGTLTSTEIGTNEISSGVITGNAVTFKVSLTFGGTSLDLGFTGTVEGNDMKGTVNVPGQGAAPFTGTRAPGAGEEELR